MALHSRFRAIRSNKSKRTTLPTATPDNRQWETDMGNGFIRVDNGAPPPRLPSESQPNPIIRTDGVYPVYPPTSPTIGLGVMAEAATVTKPVNHNTQPPDWRREFGLGK